MDNPTITKQFLATRAFIVHDGKVLIIRESQKYESGANKGKYDFPGGKLKPGEYFIDALKREALEECGLDIEIGKPFYVAEWGSKLKVQIVGIFFECTVNSTTVTLSADHDDFKWIKLEEYKQFDLIKENADACEAYLNV